MNNLKFLGGLIGLGLLLESLPAIAQIPSHPASPHSKFERVEQPLTTKIGVALGGLTLIGLELWWFLGSQPTAKPVDRADSGNLR